MLNQLPKIVTKSKKRKGTGFGSGRGGHTVGRGAKGQKAKRKIHPLFEGTKNKKSLLQRLPLLRGKGKLKPKNKKAVISISKLEKLPENSQVDVQLLIKHGLVSKGATQNRVKILNNGSLSKKFTTLIPTSRQAAKKFTQA